MPFITPQTKVMAVPKPKEQWLFVVAPSEASDDGSFAIPGRNNEPLAFYLERMGEKNAQLQAAGQAPMLEEELIAARLYSGPMFAKYNGALRFYTGKQSYSKSEVAACANAKQPCPSYLQAQCESALKLGSWSTDAEGTLSWRWANPYVTVRDQ